MNMRKIITSLACVLSLCAVLAAATPTAAEAGILQDIANEIDKCRHKPLRCRPEPQRPVLDLCSKNLRKYETDLRSKVRGWRQLPPELIEVLERHYPQVNLHDIRYAERISTAGDAAVTFGRRIYFPTKVDFTDPSHVHWMLHELEHSVQYANRGGRSKFLCEYAAKVIGKGFRHDAMDVERAADRKADKLLNRAYRALNGGYASGY